MPLLECFLRFSDYEKTFTFDFSKEELKSRIVEAYTYDNSILSKNFGRTLIENEAVDSEYRKSVDVWLDKRSWDNFKTEIRQKTADTLNLIIRKHQRRRPIRFTAIINGDERSSTLTIKDVEFERRRACNKEKDYYKVRISEKIERKFIGQLE